MKLPPLNALRAFECAARLGSFAAAGSELGVTSAAVSLQVRNLETWLGLRLFNRQANRIRLTDAGRDLYRNAASALTGIAAFTAEMTRSTPRRPLVISATPALAELWLPGRLAGFAAAHPDIPLSLRAEAELTDPETEGVDARLCYGFEHPDYSATPLFQDALVAVAATDIGNLSKAPLISVDWGRSILSVPGWRQWFAAHGQTRAGAAPEGIIASSVPAAVALVRAGAGAALLPRAVLAGELDAGTLRIIDPRSLPLPQPYVLFTAHHRAGSRRVQALIAALLPAGKAGFAAPSDAKK
jgi:LysR family glycine cleavage system transcriptional activator